MAEIEAPLLRKRSLNKTEKPQRAPASSLGKEQQAAESLDPAIQSSSWPIGIVFCIASVVLVSFYLYNQRALGSLIFGNAPLPAVRGSIDLVLHPEDHIHRDVITQHHAWTITSDYRQPDGVRKLVYLVNGEFALPTIEARSGDTLVIEVQNGLSEGVSLHWHGLRMEGANEMDGAVGMTQCPIAPGRNFTYTFKLHEKQHGTFWWHAHENTQRADGLYGGLVIHRPDEGQSLDADRFSYAEERLLLIGDWYHRPAREVMDWYLQAASFGNEPVPDSLLVNGKGAYNCSDAVPARPIECTPTGAQHLPALAVDTSKSYRFRVVNVGSLAGFTLSIPGARLTAITVDGGHEIDNTPAESVGILYPGERVDIVVDWPSTASPASSRLIVELSEENFRYHNFALSPVHTFPVHDTRSSQRHADPDPGPFTFKASSVFDLSAINASKPHSFQLQDADEVLLLYATTKKLASLDNIPYGFFNHTSWKQQQDPPGPLISLARPAWDKHQFVPYIKSPKAKPTVVDLVINNPDDGSHPVHLHGHDFHVLQVCVDGTYWGSYSPFEDEEPPCGPYNLESPVRRDTVTIPRRGYAVVRFLADNPGIWMLHCHLLWHQAAGMAMGLHIGVGDDSETSVISGWSKERARALTDNCVAQG